MLKVPKVAKVPKVLKVLKVPMVPKIPKVPKVLKVPNVINIHISASAYPYNVNPHNVNQNTCVLHFEKTIRHSF